LSFVYLFITESCAVCRWCFRTNNKLLVSWPSE